MKKTETKPAQKEQYTTLDKIKFTHAENGAIRASNGNTSFSDLFTIGAFSLTSKHKFTSKTGYKEYPTDIEGLEALKSKSDGALDAISDTIATLGLMLVYVDKDELGDNHLGTYAWLVAGLGELLGQLTFEHSEICHTLNHLSKQNEKT